MNNATQDYRALAVFTPLGRNALLLRRFTGTERLSSLYEYELEMLSESDDLDPAGIVGRQITWRVDRDGSELRWFDGFVTSFEQSGSDDRYTVYRARVSPWLWFLTQSSDCRVFQDLSTPQIVEQVFRALGFTGFEFMLSEDYEARPYCVQYRETDFEFVSRLLEEEGIYYYFTHDNGEHRLMIADSPYGFFDLPEKQLEFSDVLRTVGRVDQIKSWQRSLKFRPGRFSHVDHNHQTPRRRLLCGSDGRLSVGPSASLEIYDNHGRYDSSSQGNRWSRIRMEQIESLQERATGTSTCRGLTPGGVFEIATHRSSAEVGRQYTLFEVATTAAIKGAFTSGQENEELEFENRFVCFPADVPFRPESHTKRPVVEGPQTATVVGPAGEEIYTDELGRIKVQFHWDRLGSYDESSSCWVRVSQTHAGNGWGSISIPRIGEEVIVSFLEGDPDRPIVKGRVYNGEQRAPYALPGEMTRSGGKSNTHKGSGYNEVSMDDTAGNEQMRTNAQHNMDTAVGNSETMAVGNDQAEDVGNNLTRKVGVNASQEVGNNESMTVGSEMNIDVGNHLVIKAGTSITLTVGGSTIHMNQAGVISISCQFFASAAAALNTTVAPITSVVGSDMMNTAGLINLAVGGIVKVEGTTTSVNGSAIDVRGGMVVAKGAPLMLGEVGTPGLTTTCTGMGGGGGPAGPDGPAAASSSAGAATGNTGTDEGAEVDPSTSNADTTSQGDAEPADDSQPTDSENSGADNSGAENSDTDSDHAAGPEPEDEEPSTEPNYTPIDPDDTGFDSLEDMLAEEQPPHTPLKPDVILVGIDGTESDDRRRDGSDREYVKEDRVRSHVENFVNDYPGVDGVDKRYFDGPETMGFNTGEIRDEARQWACEQLAEDPDRSLAVIGHSRGGYNAIELARDLQENGCQSDNMSFEPKVRFVGALDPVDMTPNENWGSSELMPSNVEHPMVTLAGPKEGFGFHDGQPAVQSRNWWDRHYSGDEQPRENPTKVYEVFGTHAAHGGQPGSYRPMPLGHTQQSDIEAAVKVDQILRREAQQAGLPIPSVDPNTGYGYQPIPPPAPQPRRPVVPGMSQEEFYRQQLRPWQNPPMR